MNIPLKELHEEMLVKEEMNDDLSIIGVSSSKDKKLFANIPQIKCPKHEQEIIELICTLPECPYSRTFCKQCNLEEIIKNNSQHFTSHKDSINNINLFFRENFQNVLRCKESPEFQEDLKRAFEIIEKLKESLENDQMKKLVKLDISYLTDSAFSLQDQIENTNRSLYGRVLKKNIFSKEKQLKKKKNTKELEKIMKKTQALTANYLNNFLNKSKDISFLDKVDKIIEYIKTNQLKRIDTEMCQIREEIIEVEEEKRNEKRIFQESEEEKLIVKSLKKIKKEIKNYKASIDNAVDQKNDTTNKNDNILAIREKNEEKTIKLEKNNF